MTSKVTINLLLAITVKARIKIMKRHRLSRFEIHIPASLSGGGSPLGRPSPPRKAWKKGRAAEGGAPFTLGGAGGAPRALN